MYVWGVNLHYVHGPGLYTPGAHDRVNCRTTLEGHTCHPGCMVVSQITLIKNSTHFKIYKYIQRTVYYKQETANLSRIKLTKIQALALAITLRYTNLND